jgi:hypothetical protein
MSTGSVLEYQQFFFFGPKLLGSCMRSKTAQVFPVPAEPLSMLFFCGCCGEVFAKAPCQHTETGQQSQWQSFRMLCERCADSSQTMLRVPGSIIRNYDSETTDCLPDEVLHREVLLHIKHFEKIGLQNDE